MTIRTVLLSTGLMLGLLAVCLPASGAEIYKWTDADGTVHYSDRPVPQSKPANLPKLQPAESVPTAPVTQNKSTNAASSPVEVALVRPLPEQTFTDARGLVSVQAQVSPALGPGQQLVYYLDGSPTPGSPTRSTSLQLQNVPRGEHLLSVTVVDGNKELSRSQSVVFYSKPPSVLGPTSTSDAGQDQQPAGATTAPPTVRSPGTPAAPRFGTSSGVAGP